LRSRQQRHRRLQWQQPVGLLQQHQATEQRPRRRPRGDRHGHRTVRQRPDRQGRRPRQL